VGQIPMYTFDVAEDVVLLCRGASLLLGKTCFFFPFFYYLNVGEIDLWCQINFSDIKQ
jgi:hypothetical protein